MSGPVEAGLPVPQGDYATAKRHHDLVFTSGMTPRRNGVLIQEGPILRDAPLDSYKEAVVLAASNALMAAQSLLAEGEAIAGVVNLTVYINAENGFVSHAKLADFASGFFKGQLGAAGIGARAALGVATLPGNAPVEIQLIAAVGPA